MRVIRPHEGPQEQFLSSPADIVIYGGAAGGGKTYGLLLDPLRYVSNPRFGAVIFRRTSTQVRNEGGLWDDSMGLYPLIGGVPLEYKLQWKFPSGAKLQFRHIEHEKDKLEYQGAQIAWIGFDELTHFSESQFFYLLSRNRSTCGVPPCVRATCNPDADSWVRQFIDWWIGDDGFADKSRCGVLRWFYRVDGQVRWFDSKESAKAAFPDMGADPKSVTFIAATLDDNPTLTRIDPGYRANLMALHLVDRERLLGGNWDIRPNAGMVFKEDWLTQFVDAIPHDAKFVRYWDKAGAEPDTDGDWSAGCLMARKGPLYYICDMRHGQWSPFSRNKVIRATAERDDPKVDLWIEQEPGNGGKESMMVSARELSEFGPRFDRPTQNKLVRAKPFAAQCEAGNVFIVRGPWNQSLIDELVNFPDENWHDDQVDACSGAFMKLQHTRSTSAKAPVGIKGKRR